MGEKSSEYLHGRTKRQLDLLGSLSLAGVLAAPAVAIGVVSSVEGKRWNPLFNQQRVDGVNTTLLVRKFRTLVERQSESEIITFGTYDARASKIGQIIRQSGLDEIPQLGAIVSGTMSLVGPRPMLQRDVERMADAGPKVFDDWYDFYTSTKKGVMGMSNAYRHHFMRGVEPSIYRRCMDLDLNYRDNASLTEDLRIIGRTPLSMVFSGLHPIDNRDSHNDELEQQLADNWLPHKHAA